MGFKKMIFAFVLVTVFPYFCWGEPIPLKEISRRIRGNSNLPAIYDRSPRVEVMVEFGIASWYDCPIKPELVHHKTLGVKDRIFPVAHKTLPFGTLIKVINPRNGKKILTRVIDRGPYISGRIIDLDYFGAKALEISGVGKIVLKIFKMSSSRKEQIPSQDKG